MGQGNLAEAAGEILLMEEFDLGEVQLEFLLNFSRQECGPIPSTLRVPDDNLARREIEVLDPQADALTQPEPAAVKQFDHESIDAGETSNHALGLFLREHNRHVAMGLGTDGLDG